MEKEKNGLQKKLKKKKNIAKIVSSVLFGRLALCFFLLLLQILLFWVFVEKLVSYIPFYFGGSILFSAGFMVYLANSKTKNEFKIAWLLPMILFPIVGVCAYTVYHIDYGGYKFKKKFLQIKEKTASFLENAENQESAENSYPEISDLLFYLRNSVRFPSYENNALEYYPCGEDFFPDFLEELRKAEKFIFIEFFIINSDESWDAVLSILSEKAKKGVEVRILFDAIGSVSVSSRIFVNYLKKLGINAQIFSPITPFFSIHYNNRDHRKIVVIDGKTAFTGGLNITNEYFNAGSERFAYWKDSAVKVKGGGVKSFTSMFLCTWSLGLKQNDDFEKYINAPCGKFAENGVIAPYGDNAFNNDDVAENIYLWIINSAKNYVHITTPYLIIDDRLSEALVFAVRRGVDVSIIVPGKHDHFVTYAIGKTFIDDLVQKGVKIYTYRDDSFIHSKNFVSDGKTATIGSINLDYRSLYHHFECGLLIHKNDEIQKFEDDFQATLKDCVLLENGFYKKLPFFMRAVGRALKIMSPLF